MFADGKPSQADRRAYMAYSFRYPFIFLSGKLDDRLAKSSLSPMQNREPISVPPPVKLRWTRRSNEPDVTLHEIRRLWARERITDHGRKGRGREDFRATLRPKTVVGFPAVAVCRLLLGYYTRRTAWHR